MATQWEGMLSYPLLLGAINFNISIGSEANKKTPRVV